MARRKRWLDEDRDRLEEIARKKRSIDAGQKTI